MNRWKHDTASSNKCGTTLVSVARHSLCRMAGGMTPGGRENLAQRVANTRARAGGHGTSDQHGKRPASWAESLAESPEPVTPPAIRPSWYDGPYGRPSALLLEWRNTGGHHDGRIVVAALEADGWGIVEMWVGQEMLSPA